MDFIPKTFPNLTIHLVTNFYFIYSILKLMAQLTIGFDIAKSKAILHSCGNWGSDFCTLKHLPTRQIIGLKFGFNLFQLKIDFIINHWFQHHRSKTMIQCWQNQTHYLCTKKLCSIFDNLFLLANRGHIFIHVRPFYEQAVSDLDRPMYRSLWV